MVSLKSRYFFLTFTLSLLSFFTYFFWPSDYISLEKKELITDETLYQLEPSWSPKKKELHLEINIESFQNPLSLEVDFKEQLLLEDNFENIYEPVKWHFIYKQPNQIRAMVVFKVKQNLGTFSLKYFGLETLNFGWFLNKNP